jgi:hypothetical protein
MSVTLPFAHALVAKQDLPIPAWLFAWAATIVLVVSFFALSAAWRKPQFEEECWRPSAAWLTTVLRSWLARLPPRLTLPVLGDSRLHLFRPSPALGGRDLMRGGTR